MGRLTIGSVFAGQWRVHRLLSTTLLSTVYVAEQVSTGRLRALKLLHPFLVSDQKSRERFRLEARIGSHIQSEHVIDVVDAGVDEQGIPWLAMELLEGHDLDELVRERGPLAPVEVLGVFRQLGHALTAAHQAGVIHRDLKPANLFLAKTNRVSGPPTVLKVLDFGLAKLVHDHGLPPTQPFGALYFAAPEQLEAPCQATPATDLWPLGLIAFYLLMGRYYWRTAAQDASTQGWMREVLDAPLDPATVRAAAFGLTPSILPPTFDQWFARCVSRDPDGRFNNVAESIMALERVLAPADDAIATVGDRREIGSGEPPNPQSLPLTPTTGLDAPPPRLVIAGLPPPTEPFDRASPAAAPTVPLDRPPPRLAIPGLPPPTVPFDSNVQDDALRRLFVGFDQLENLRRRDPEYQRECEREVHPTAEEWAKDHFGRGGSTRDKVTGEVCRTFEEYQAQRERDRKQEYENRLSRRLGLTELGVDETELSKIFSTSPTSPLVLQACVPRVLSLLPRPKAGFSLGRPQAEWEVGNCDARRLCDHNNAAYRRLYQDALEVRVARGDASGGAVARALCNAAEVIEAYYRWRKPPPLAAFLADYTQYVVALWFLFRSEVLSRITSSSAGSTLFAATHDPRLCCLDKRGSLRPDLDFGSWFKGELLDRFRRVPAGWELLRDDLSPFGQSLLGVGTGGLHHKWPDASTLLLLHLLDEHLMLEHNGLRACTPDRPG